MGADKHSLGGRSFPLRRHQPRVEASGDIRVYWICEGRADTAPVRDLSTGGLFIETEEARDVGTTVRLHFLVPEGPIRAEAVVRHVKRGKGLGLKFTALRAEDGPHLAALITRLRDLPRSPLQSK